MHPSAHHDKTCFLNLTDSTWAALFDIFRWPWRYRALDLRNYTPAFILNFDRPILVHIDPQPMSQDELTPRRIAQSGWQNEFLILASSPTLFEDLPCLGSLYIPKRTIPDNQALDFVPDKAILFTCHTCQRPSLRAYRDSHHCRLHGCPNTDTHALLATITSLSTYWQQALRASA
jgi:hypothetical protein